MPLSILVYARCVLPCDVIVFCKSAVRSTPLLQQLRPAWYSTESAASSGSDTAETFSKGVKQSISSDPFLPHLQHKTESELIELLGSRNKGRSTQETQNDDEVHRCQSRRYQCFASQVKSFHRVVTLFVFCRNR